MIEIFNDDCKNVLKLNKTFDVCYADVIYESNDFSWADLAYEHLNKNGIFYLQTDYHTVAEWKLKLDSLFGRENLVNWISIEFDWGGRSTRSFARKTDFILMYSKGKNYKFYSERILIPKVTAGTKLDKKGTGLKIPTDFWKDMSFSTLAKERVKFIDYKNIRWQKSLKLMERLLLPVTDIEDLVIDPFLGSGTTGVWCKNNKRDFIGIEINKTVFNIAEKRINNA